MLGFTKTRIRFPPPSAISANSKNMTILAVINMDPVYLLSCIRDSGSPFQPFLCVYKAKKPRFSGDPKPWNLNKTHIQHSETCY